MVHAVPGPEVHADAAAAAAAAEGVSTAAAEGVSSAVAGMAGGLRVVVLAADGRRCLLASFGLRDSGAWQWQALALQHFSLQSHEYQRLNHEFILQKASSWT